MAYDLTQQKAAVALRQPCYEGQIVICDQGLRSLNLLQDWNLDVGTIQNISKNYIDVKLSRGACYNFRANPQCYELADLCVFPGEPFIEQVYNSFPCTIEYAFLDKLLPAVYPKVGSKVRKWESFRKNWGGWLTVLRTTEDCVECDDGYYAMWLLQLQSPNSSEELVVVPTLKTKDKGGCPRIGCPDFNPAVGEHTTMFTQENHCSKCGYPGFIPKTGWCQHDRLRIGYDGEISCLRDGCQAQFSTKGLGADIVKPNTKLHRCKTVPRDQADKQSFFVELDLKQLAERGLSQQILTLEPANDMAKPPVDGWVWKERGNRY